MNNPTETLFQAEQEILIRLYGNRMEQAMNAGSRTEAVKWMNLMYAEIKNRNKKSFNAFMEIAYSERQKVIDSVGM